ncbi:hypothetical protein DFR74_1086 [Nocardia puris]|uniref:Helix-turn-helix protein n=1 Tax=Nocardia puris TaxID=208602 RepID=A0A366DFE1_9NOCA|nr:hypothetical protein DFR74_1086 [Nocardia puris]
MTNRPSNARFDVVHHGGLGANPDGTKLYASLPMGLARDPRLSHAARSVALYVWSHKPSRHQSAKVVADDLAMDRKTVAKALGDLQDNGWLVRQSYFRTGQGRQSFEVWHLQMSNTPFTPGQIGSLSRRVEFGHGEKIPTPHGEEAVTPMGKNSPPPWGENGHHSSRCSSSEEVEKVVEEIGSMDPDTSAEAMGSGDPSNTREGPSLLRRSLPGVPDWDKTDGWLENINPEGNDRVSTEMGSPWDSPNTGSATGSSPWPRRSKCIRSSCSDPWCEVHATASDQAPF